MTNQTVDVLLERLQSLMGNLDFSWDDKAFDSPELALTTGERINREHERLEAMGEEKQERIMSRMFSLFATMLQMLAIETYGNDEIPSIRRVIEDTYNKPNVKAELSRLRHTIEKALRASTLTKEQCDILLNGFIDEIPLLMVDWLTEMYVPYRSLPLTETRSIAAALADMMKEVGDADSV